MPLSMLCILLWNNPRKEYYGSQVAAPVFAQIGSYLMRHSGMAPVLLSEKNVIVPQQVKTRAIDVVKKDFQKELQQNRVPDLYGLTLREVLHTIKSSNLKIKVKGHWHSDKNNSNTTRAVAKK